MRRPAVLPPLLAAVLALSPGLSGGVAIAGSRSTVGSRFLDTMTPTGAFAHPAAQPGPTAAQPRDAAAPTGAFAHAAAQPGHARAAPAPLIGRAGSTRRHPAGYYLAVTVIIGALAFAGFAIRRRR